LIYKYYLGDGDTSSYNDVVKKHQKLECVGHIQKRIGTRLRKRRKEVHNAKRLTGKGKITESAVNTIQNYFGMAIRQIAADASLSEKEKVYQKKHSCHTLSLY